MTEGLAKGRQYVELAKMLVMERVSHSEAARRLGVSRQTIYNWRADPAYKLILDDLVDGHLQAARLEMRAMVADAVETVRDCLKTESADAAGARVRLEAAREVFKMARLVPQEATEDEDLTDEQLEDVARRVGWSMEARQ